MVWFYLVNLVFKPSKHVSNVRQDHALLLCALVNGFELNVGKIVNESILDYAKNNFSWNIPHPSLTTLLCIKGGGGGGGGGGVKFNEEEEKSPKASPLTLTGVLEALKEGEDVKRRKKTKKNKGTA